MNPAEREANRELKLVLLGSDKTNGLCKMSRFLYLDMRSTVPLFVGMLCCLGVMSISEETDLRSVKMFPSQWKPLESVR